MEDCETIHGIECETEEVILPKELLEILENERDFVMQGQAVALAYDIGEPEVPEHEFDKAIVLYAGPGMIAILGNFIVDDRGIVNVPQETE